MFEKFSHGHCVWVYAFFIWLLQDIRKFSCKNHSDRPGNLFKFRYGNITKGIYFKALLYFLVDELTYVFVLFFGNLKKLTNTIEYSYSIVAMLFGGHLSSLMVIYFVGWGSGCQWVKSHAA